MSFNSPELVRSSQQGDLAAVQRLVESGADVNSIGEHGMGSLLTFTPAVTEYLLSIRFLLQSGADKSIRDANGDSPQSWASWHWRPKPLIDLLNPHIGTR